MDGGGGRGKFWSSLCEAKKPNVKYATSKTEAEWKRMENAERDREREQRGMKMKTE